MGAACRAAEGRLRAAHWEGCTLNELKGTQRPAQRLCAPISHVTLLRLLPETERLVSVKPDFIDISSVLTDTSLVDWQEIQV